MDWENIKGTGTHGLFNSTAGTCGDLSPVTTHAKPEMKLLVFHPSSEEQPKEDVVACTMPVWRRPWEGYHSF